ncbi:MAG: hypothetical protein GKR89_09325 [Candidatus Latescibacteria bacterium]|nr:hypothetical protein [Candidatus Latescibacterota bacterium]
MAAKPLYRVGLIGCGRKGHGHARGYLGNPRTELVAAADPDSSNRQIFLDRFKVAGYAEYADLLARGDIDIAAPILPVQPNPQVVIDCARAGVKAIYCEKPMAASLEEADAMVAECASRGIHLAAGDAYRTMPQHWKVKALIDAGELGAVQSINLYQSTSEISGGGCQGLSVLRLFADDAEVDWATGWCQRDPWDDEDQNMGGHFRFTTGVDAFIHSRRTALEGLEVCCENGVYHTYWGGGTLWRGEANQGLEADREFFAEYGGPSGWMEPRGRRQRAGVQSVVEALDGDIAEPRCSGANMAKVLEMAIGLRQSHRQDFAPVRFPVEDRGLKIVPYKSRYLNKKETLGETGYASQIETAAAQPIGGAQVE